MRAVLQRVSFAQVSVGESIVGKIGKGLLVLLGISKEDSEAEAATLADKIINLRIFSDPHGKMNLSLDDVDGQLLVVSQFTVYGDSRRGRRPSFAKAAAASDAIRLYEYFNDQARQRGIHTESGIFGAMMNVSLVNDGPVTLILDTDDWK
jgi:D-tyrosyl-tRNA(Tyr) deacylase